MPASTSDVALTDAIQAGLAGRDPLPETHLLDTGSVSAAHLLASELAYGVDLVGPVLLDTSGQAAADEGFDLTRFAIDWGRQTVPCPRGETSRPWTAASRADYPFHQVRFAKAGCLACPVRARGARRPAHRASTPSGRDLRRALSAAGGRGGGHRPGGARGRPAAGTLPDAAEGAAGARGDRRGHQPATAR